MKKILLIALCIGILFLVGCSTKNDSFEDYLGWCDEESGKESYRLVVVKEYLTLYSSLIPGTIIWSSEWQSDKEFDIRFLIDSVFKESVTDKISDHYNNDHRLIFEKFIMKTETKKLINDPDPNFDKYKKWKELK